jgi:hypothetical protein
VHPGAAVSKNTGADHRASEGTAAKRAALHADRASSWGRNKNLGERHKGRDASQMSARCCGHQYSVGLSTAGTCSEVQRGAAALYAVSNVFTIVSRCVIESREHVKTIATGRNVDVGQ